MKRLHVVTICLGNICRSPLMEALLRQAWEQHSARPPDLQLTVESAGLNPMLDYPTQEAVLTGRELGVDIVEHRSRQVDAAMAARADVLVTATASMMASLTGRFEKRGRVCTFAELAGEAPADIEDPYGRTLARYREVALQIQRYARASVPRLIALSAEEK